MSSAHRMFLFAALLCVGACTASLFRKPAGSVASAPVAAELPHRAGGAQVVWGPPRVDRAPEGPPSVAADAPTVLLSRQDAPPDLPPDSPLGPFPWRAGADRGESAGAGATPNRHRVVDGDSLAGLAERYLGDASRAGDIAAANQGVIGPAGALPIGVDLVIPLTNAGDIPRAGAAEVHDEPGESPLPPGLIRPASVAGE